jgi:hypothetical protein
MKHCLLVMIVAFALAANGEDLAQPALPMNRPSDTLKGLVPSWFTGVWTREWIQVKGKPRDGSTMVRNVQTPILYGDVRIPASRPSFPHANSLGDLTDQELAALFRQNGFSGSTSVQGNISTWSHDIEYRPPSGDDIGRLEQAGPSTVRESGLDNSFVESWWSLSSGDGKYLGIKVTTSAAGIERADRILTVAGDHFVFARNRPKDLPPAKSFADLIAKTQANRATIIEYLDCELSYGLVRGGKIRWEIQLSTFPWKEGKHLEFVDQITLNASTGKLEPGKSVRFGEKWTFPVNTMKIDDLKKLFLFQGIQ